MCIRSRDLTHPKSKELQRVCLDLKLHWGTRVLLGSVFFGVDRTCGSPMKEPYEHRVRWFRYWCWTTISTVYVLRASATTPAPSLW